MAVAFIRTSRALFELRAFKYFGCPNVNGPVMDGITFMFNTDYNRSSNKLTVARIELSPKFNIWAGRFLPPSDRANFYGPYTRIHAHEWACIVTNCIIS